MVVKVEPGAVVQSCHIRTNGPSEPNGASEPYVVQFHFGGRVCTCPLFLFQSRTQAMDVVSRTPICEAAVQ